MSGRAAEQLLRGLPVGGEVVLAAKNVVIESWRRSAPMYQYQLAPAPLPLNRFTTSVSGQKC